MKKKTFLIILTLVFICFSGAFKLHLLLAEDRAGCNLQSEVSLENVSPLIAFTTIALGGFRGIIADMLWMRATRLQEEHCFFESAQLADWITKLEPHFPAVWAFHAWNMAYNISILFPEPENRWRWVQHGISLLRDEALTINPRVPVLYYELAWLYQHKIGFVMDEAHWYYKFQLAQQMAELFDGPRPDYEKLSKDSSARLQNEYKLIPKIMKKLEQEYGLLDWRLPATHALYWAYRGISLKPAGKSGFICQRMILQSIMEAFRHGKLFIEPENELFLTVPNLNILPNAVNTYEQAIAKYDDVVFHEAYVRFLMDAIVILYSYNHILQAKQVFVKLSRKYPDAVHDLDFNAFIASSFIQDVKNTPEERIIALVEGFLFQSYFWLALGEHDRATGFERLSKLLFYKYTESRMSENHLKRTGLPSWEVIRQKAYQRAISEISQTNLVVRLKALAPSNALPTLQEPAQ